MKSPSLVSKISRFSTFNLTSGLLREGVIVRPIGVYEMPTWLRVSIGLPEENQRFLDALAKVLAA